MLAGQGILEVKRNLRKLRFVGAFFLGWGCGTAFGDRLKAEALGISALLVTAVIADATLLLTAGGVRPCAVIPNPTVDRANQNRRDCQA
jgi:hypothetical protein